MSDSDKTLRVKIEVDGYVMPGAKEAQDTLEAAARKTADEMGVVTVSQRDVEAATKSAADTVEKGSEKWGEHRRELREVGNELGRATGISHLGGLALGGVAAAAFGAAKAIEFLKHTWEDIQSAITGEIKVGLPEDAAEHISAAAAAWQEYADARAKVIASQNSPEASASAEEKRLQNELKLVKEVMAAEKEKALADLELHKKEMSPEAYNAARENIGSIFSEAGTKAEEANQRQQIANKAREAANLEIDARQKTQQALAIKVAPEAEAEANQKVLEENAAAAEKQLALSKANLAMIARQKKSGTGNIPGTDAEGGDVLEYEGLGGKFKQAGETWDFKKKYGYNASIEDAQKIEETRMMQAEAQIAAAASYAKRQEENRKQQAKIMDEAGSESGKAAGLRREVNTESIAEAQQNAVASHIAEIHQASANRITAQSQQAAAAVERFTSATVAGFEDVHAVFMDHQRQIETLREQIRSARRDNMN